MVAWLRERSRGGRLVMRMEDLDHPRHKPGADTSILEDLKWLGFDWDEGPDVGGPNGPYVQSQRMPLYEEAFGRLVKSGRLYPCICSRKDCETALSAPHSNEDGILYTGRCRGRFSSYDEAVAAIGPGREPAWRFRVGDGAVETFTDFFAGPQSFDVSKQTGDFVLGRGRIGAGYMLGVVVDDAAMGVTEVVRGDDLLPATGRQLMLYRALGLTPPDFLHVPMVVGENGMRLAKRHGDTRIAACREAGVVPEEIIGVLAWWSGLAEYGERLSLRDLLPRFDLAKIPKAPAVLTDEVRSLLKVR